MAITLEGTSVKYTISTPSTITINESNIDTYFYNWKPTVTRNKTGSAATRYIVFDLNGDGTNIAAYRAVFTATGKTATVTAYTSAFGMARYGDIANWNFTKLGVGIASSTALSYFDYGTVACSKTINLYPTITLTPTYTQSSPSQSVFGRQKLPQMVSTALNTITQNLPAVLDKGREIIVNLVQGLLANLPTLINAATNIAKQIPDFLQKNIPVVAAKAGELAGCGFIPDTDSKCPGETGRTRS